jgi:cardiolipin synthase
VNSPNILTLTRIAATPVIVALAASDGANGSLAAAVLFAAAGLTDWLDGYLARRLNQMSKLGAMLDPIADKLQVVVTLGVLLWLGVFIGWHVAAPLAILAREILVSGLREAMASMNAPRIPSSFAAKIKTTAQMIAITFLLFGGVVGPSWARDIGLILLWGAAILTLWTGAAYLRAALTAIQRED